MLALLAMATLSMSPLPVINAYDLQTIAGKIPKSLFYLAEVPSGIMFCDTKMKKRQMRRFDEQYGERFNRIAEIVAARDGLQWQPGDGIVQPCWLPTKREAEQMLEDFGKRLSVLEHQYNP